MSEAWTAQGAGLAGQPAANDGVTAGTMLRRAREAAGLHVAALAVSLKVPVYKLEALEDDRHDLLTDLVFVRALASSVCRTLKIDPQPVLERLPRTATPRLVPDSDGINTPFRAPSDGVAPGWRDQLTRPVFLVVLALLVGALVVVFLPVQPDADPAPAQADKTSISPPVAVEPVPVVAPPPSEAVKDVAVAPAMESALAPQAPAIAPAVPPAAAVVAATAPAAAASGILVFRAKGPSWVEVKDARGAVAVRKTLTAGESYGASGALPLQVTIGRVDATEVQLRGKPFDLGPVSKDNVARFEVK
jgi:cytoskeleton protein RodZ